MDRVRGLIVALGQEEEQGGVIYSVSIFIMYTGTKQKHAIVRYIQVVTREKIIYI